MTAFTVLQRISALICLLIVLPLMLLLASMVLLSLGRPVLFRQSRSGHDGRPFTLVKFRTMTDKRGPDGRLLPDGLRVTRVGNWLRRSRLDELPELLNIARGEMAFIGPRPLLPETVAAMGEGGVIRSSVLPGLTGWSQVSGNTLLSNTQKLTLDIWYVQNRSAAVDMRILWKTIAVVIRGERLAD